MLERLDDIMPLISTDAATIYLTQRAPPLRLERMTRGPMSRHPMLQERSVWPFPPRITEPD